MLDYDALELNIKKVKDIFRPFIRVKDADKKHSLYSPSAMDRILGCAGSTQLNKDIPGKDSVYSIAGTHTHTLMEFILKHHEKLLRHVGAREFKEHLGYTIEMEIAAMVAVKFAREVMKSMPKPTLMVEVKSRLDEIVNEDCGGTADIVIYQRFKTLHVIDYKNGVSIVEAENNKQLMTYALGLLHKFGWDFKDVHISIVQPNAKHRAGPVRTWKTTIARLEEFEKELVAGIRASKKPNAPLQMDSKYCYFCPANQAKKCPLKNEVDRKNVMDKFFNKKRGPIMAQKKAAKKKVVKTKTKKPAGKVSSKGKAYYTEDLIGMEVIFSKSMDGNKLVGTIAAIAGDFILIDPPIEKPHPDQQHLPGMMPEPDDFEDDETNDKEGK